jgi:opacity protein-like surface antigen
MMINSSVKSIFVCVGVMVACGGDAVRAGIGDYVEPLDSPSYVDPNNDGWDIQFRPYLWTASIDGTAGVGGVEAPIDIDFSDLLDALDFTWSSTFDIKRTGSKWSLLVDTFYLKLGPDTPAFIDDVKVEQAIIDPMIGYNLAEWNHGRSWLRVIGGVRWMYMNIEIEPAGGSRLKHDESWFDPHVGLIMRHYFNDCIYFNGAVDYGGFGIESDYVYQILSGLGYRVNPRMSFEFFYRYFDIDYENDGFIWDTRTSGVFLGAAFYF